MKFMAAILVLFAVAVNAADLGGIVYESASQNIVYVYPSNLTVNISNPYDSYVYGTYNRTNLFPALSPEWAAFRYVYVTNLTDVRSYRDAPPGSKTNASQVVVLTDTQAEAEWQNQKSSTLKSVENMYVDFLTNDWTMCLRGYGVIGSGSTITVTNTSEITNIGYLMQVRAADTNANKPTYSFMAGEFDRFKLVITGNGGIMSKVERHE